MGDFIQYNEDEKQAARDKDMIDVIFYFRGFTFFQDGRSYRCKEHNSLVVDADRHNWYWNSKSKGGYGAVSWLMEIEGYSFTKAVGTLINKLPSGQQSISGLKFQSPNNNNLTEKENIFSLPIKANTKYSNVYMYLTKSRGIAPEIVTYCFSQGFLYQDDHKNCVFVGYDEKNKPRFAEVRSSSTDVKYRHNVLGSSKEYSFNISASSPTSRVFVFESPIDLLSHATLNCMNVKKLTFDKGLEYDKKCWLKHNRLSLSGTSYQVALEAYLQRHPEIKSIACCLDNDNAGKETANKIYKQYTKQGYLVTIHRPSIGKDYNDTLVALNHQQAEQTEQPAFLIAPEQPKR